MGDLPTVFILAGGLGTRLQSVVYDRPKTLAEAEGTPFLEFQLKWLEKQGVSEVILLTGYMSDKIKSFISDGSTWDLDIRIIQENTPLGTGGAILHAMKILDTKQEFILFNGDTLAELSLKDFYDNRKNDMLAQLVAVYQEDTSRFGTVKFDDKFNLLGFQEKISDCQEGWINAGIYYFPEGWFEDCGFSGGPISLEKDMFPKWISTYHCTQVYPIQGHFIDIGTPDSYAHFQQESKLWHKKLLL
jgi:NDP-sugar pyrophosphorylase family protein